MTQREDSVRRRDKRGPARRESIEELYGDVLTPAPVGLFDADDPAPDAPARPDAAPSAPADGGAKGPHGAYRAITEGAPGGFKRSGRLEYPPHGGDLTPIVLSHGLITLMTLGFWRFWQVAAQRRSIWAHTKLAGEPFEYRGTGLEMFIGTTFVAALLGAMMLVAQMALGWLGYASPFHERVGLSVATQAVALAGAAMLLPLIEYARFRARRYRLRRTRWRAIRFDMHGSGLGLVARWAMWAPVVVATLGLAAPFLTMARERHMIERSFWGDEPMFFRGSAWRLMPYWTLLWLMLIVPAAIGGAHVWQTVERAGAAPVAADPAAATDLSRLGTPWDAADVSPAPTADRGTPEPVRIIPPTDRAPAQRLDLMAPAPQTPQTPQSSPELLAVQNAAAALVPIRDRIVAATDIVTAAGPQTQRLIAILWPVLFFAAAFGYRGARIREMMNARRIAGARARCTFGGVALLYGWLVMVGRTIWPGLLVYVLVGVVTGILFFSIRSGDAATSNPFDLLQRGGDWRAQGLVIMAFAVNYGTLALFVMWLNEVVWFRTVHFALCKDTTIEGLETLDAVRQRAHARVHEADGLADALDIDLGY